MDAIEKLIDHGHKRIGMLSGPLEDPINGLQKFAGYREALEKAGIPFDESLVVVGDYSYDSAIEAMQTFLDLDEKPTAIFEQQMKWRSESFMVRKIKDTIFLMILK